MGTEAGIVHVHFGSALLDRLAAAVPGDRLEWNDPLSDGPTPSGLAPDAWYGLRAAHLHSGLYAPPADAVEADLRAQDRALADIPPDAEVVIWAGPELYCQVSLVRVLTLLGGRVARPRVSLVDPGDHPSSPGCGLTARGDEELRALFDARRLIDGDVFALADRAWAAYTAPSAAALVALVAGGTGALPHLGAALARHLEDLPDGATGLSTTETRLLQELETGALSERELLRAIARREARPFLTDTTLDGILRRLAGGDGPLIARDRVNVSITQRGRDVLHGHDFWTAERWHGGIHIREDDDEQTGATGN